MNSRVQFRIFTILDLDKKEEYLHEMHLEGWRYRASRFGLFYFDQCQPDDIIYRIYDSRLLKKHKHELQDFRNRGWELIETGFCSIFRKPASDLLSEDQVYMSKGLRWEVMRYRLRSCTATFLGGLVVCMSSFREDLSMSFFIIFVLYAFLISYLIYGYFKLKRKYLVDKQ
ncbi:PF11193 family protein [Streptococcus mitis SK579]|nr:PF11193 family protein [Streptococcus mitis SK579]